MANTDIGVKLGERLAVFADACCLPNLPSGREGAAIIEQEASRNKTFQNFLKTARRMGGDVEFGLADGLRQRIHEQSA